MFFFVQVKGSRQQFHFMAEKIEGNASGQVGEILELHFPKRDWLLRFIESNSSAVRDEFAEEDELHIG